MQDYVAILKGKGIYTNSKQVEEIFSLADRLVLCDSMGKALSLFYVVMEILSCPTVS